MDFKGFQKVYGSMLYYKIKVYEMFPGCVNKMNGEEMPEINPKVGIKKGRCLTPTFPYKPLESEHRWG